MLTVAEYKNLKDSLLKIFNDSVNEDQNTPAVLRTDDSSYGQKAITAIQSLSDHAHDVLINDKMLYPLEPQEFAYIKKGLMKICNHYKERLGEKPTFSRDADPDQMYLDASLALNDLFGVMSAIEEKEYEAEEALRKQEDPNIRQYNPDDDMPGYNNNRNRGMPPPGAE